MVEEDIARVVPWEELGLRLDAPRVDVELAFGLRKEID